MGVDNLTRLSYELFVSLCAWTMDRPENSSWTMDRPENNNYSLVPIFSYEHVRRSGSYRTISTSSNESTPLISQPRNFTPKKLHVAIFVLVMSVVIMFVVFFISTIVVCRFVNMEPDQWSRGVAEYCRVAMGRLT